jgi:hypothetical protein
MTAADAADLLVLNTSLDVTYSLFDTAANLAAEPTALNPDHAQLVTVDGTAKVAEANTLLSFNPNVGFDLLDTGANLVAQANAEFIGDPGTQFVLSGPLSGTVTVDGAAISVVDAETLLFMATSAVIYNLSDTGASVLGAQAGTVSGALSVFASDATVAEAAQLNVLPPLNASLTYSIADDSATVAAALNNGSIDFANVQAADTIGVTGIGTLTVNAEQFANLLIAGPFFAPDDTIAIDGDLFADLGTLPFFGGDITIGMTLGGAANGTYDVVMGTSGMRVITMQGTGDHFITAGFDVAEDFVMGATADGGSFIADLEVGDRINIVGGGGGLNALAEVDGTVDGAGEWQFDGSFLEWWDDASGAVFDLTLTFIGTETLDLQNGTTFDVV